MLDVEPLEMWRIKAVSVGVSRQGRHFLFSARGTDAGFQEY
jgi:hypothetical protein